VGNKIIRVTAAIFVNDGMLLIAKRKPTARLPNLWEFPGGKVDPGESPEEALCREIREELDAEIQVLNIFEVVFHRYEWGPVLVLAYSCRLLTSAIRNLGVTEHRWLYPSELPEFSILPADQPIIDRLIDPSR